MNYTSVIKTVYGDVIVNRNDLNQGQQVFATGKSTDDEDIQFLCTLLKRCGEGAVAMDIGANVGYYSLAFGKTLEPLGGKVWSIEAQRLVFNMLAGTIALNSLENVYAYNWAMGKEVGSIPIPQYDMRQPGNFGSVEFLHDSKDMGQQRLPNKEDEVVPMVPLDSWNLGRLDLLKIDIEGMEESMLAGAINTIRKHKPIVWIEWCKSDEWTLIDYFRDLGYSVYEYKNDLFCILPDQFPDIQAGLTWYKFSIDRKRGN